MKKLKLNLEDLKVESFETNSTMVKMGTVAGHATETQGPVETCYAYCITEAQTCEYTCWASCPITCAPTCGAITCAGDTCEYVTCQGASCNNITCGGPLCA